MSTKFYANRVAGLSSQLDKLAGQSRELTRTRNGYIVALHLVEGVTLTELATAHGLNKGNTSKVLATAKTMPEVMESARLIPATRDAGDAAALIIGTRIAEEQARVRAEEQAAREAEKAATVLSAREQLESTGEEFDENDVMRAVADRKGTPLTPADILRMVATAREAAVLTTWSTADLDTLTDALAEFATAVVESQTA